jgi:hypothetical protein
VSQDGNFREFSIEGITKTGFLSAKETVTGKLIELHPDNNSFDLMKNLIYPKK